jgi:hypothetical protein
LDIKKVKKYIPRWVKWLPSWLLIAPQRQEGVAYTWMVEARGLMSLARKNIRGVNPLQPITICTGIKDRTDNYLSHVLPSILRMKNKELISISIFDCGSADRDALERSIREQWQGKLHFESEQVAFSRAYSFNRAIEAAETELIFAADADLSLPAGLVGQCNRYISRHTVWYPVFFDLKKNAPEMHISAAGRWYPTSLGMFASTREQFEQAGRLNERYKKWGMEDEDLWLRFYRAGYFPIRTRPKGFFHHWHEFTDEKKEALKNKPVPS